MNFSLNKFFFFSFIVLATSSCVSRKDFVYMNNIDSKKPNETMIFEPILESNDLLTIVVTAKNAELTIPFNLPQIQSNGVQTENAIKSYLIDSNGFIDYPVLGRLQLGGLTKTDANNLLVSKISEYIKEPTVNLNITNFKVTMLGDIVRPGSLLVPSEKITILEAISQCGDLLVTGKRNNILLIREIKGKKTYNRIDLTNSSFINSDFYYLKQNDLLYVEPNKTKINSSVIGSNTGIIVSVLSTILTISLFLLSRS